MTSVWRCKWVSSELFYFKHLLAVIGKKNVESGNKVGRETKNNLLKNKLAKKKNLLHTAEGTNEP